MKGLLGAFFVEVVLVTIREVKRGGIQVPQAAPLPAPLPSTYTSVVGVYAVIAVLPRSIDPIPSLLAWGLIVATLLNFYTPGSKTAATDQNYQAVLNSLPKPATIA